MANHTLIERSPVNALQMTYSLARQNSLQARVTRPSVPRFGVQPPCICMCCRPEQNKTGRIRELPLPSERISHILSALPSFSFASIHISLRFLRHVKLEVLSPHTKDETLVYRPSSNHIPNTLEVPSQWPPFPGKRSSMSTSLHYQTKYYKVDH
jgi:hypothetical protein